MQVPKIVWQTWKTREVPDKWKPSQQAIKIFCSDWEYVLTTDEDNRNFVIARFPEYLALYDSFEKEIYRADMIRYMYLYTYGGVYLDLDLQLVKSLDDLLEYGDLFLVKTPNFGGYTNAFMASAPGNVFWLRCLEEIERRSVNKPFYIQGDLKVLYTTGPSMITKVVSEYNRPFVTIPYKLGHPCSVCDTYDGVCEDEDSYVLELEGSSWSTSAKLMHFLYCRWKLILVIIVLIILLYILFRYM